MVAKLLNILIILMICIVVQAALHFFPDAAYNITGRKIPDYTVTLVLFCVCITVAFVYDSFKTEQKIKFEIRNSRLNLDTLSQNYENKIKELRNEMEFINNKLTRQRETLNAEYNQKLEEYKIAHQSELTQSTKTSAAEEYRNFFIEIQNKHLFELNNILRSSSEGRTLLELKNKFEEIISYFKNLCYIKFFESNIFNDLQLELYERADLYSGNIKIIEYISKMNNISAYAPETIFSEAISVLSENLFGGKLYSVDKNMAFNFIIINGVDLYIFFETGYFYISNLDVINELRDYFKIKKEYGKEDLKQFQKTVKRNLPF